jgi:hypothetical protein
MSSHRTAVTLAAVSIAAASAHPVRTPSPRLLESRDVTYVGAFRLPATGANEDDFSYGGAPVAYNPNSNSLFIGSRRGNVAEVSVPSPALSPVIAELPVARYLQPFADPTEGHLAEIGSGVAPGGLLVTGQRLYGSGFIYYDAANAQTVSHYSHALALSEPSFRGIYAVGEKGKTGFVSGYMGAVPPEWQTELGGPAVTGQCCIPIISRTSWGPAVFAWNPGRLGIIKPLPVTPLLYYTENHATLGPWSGSNGAYGATTQIGGVALIIGTRTALFVGRNGIGPYCYGSGTSSDTLAHTEAADGARYCYDPANSDKGQHAYPYRYQWWAYDLDDLAAVKAGRKKPWEPNPYGVWPFTLATGTPAMTIGGVGYDALRQLLYVSQMGAEQDGYDSRPIIHVFRIR